MEFYEKQKNSKDRVLMEMWKGEGEMKSERCQRTRGLRLESGRKMGDEASEG